MMAGCSEHNDYSISSSEDASESSSLNSCPNVDPLNHQLTTDADTDSLRQPINQITNQSLNQSIDQSIKTTDSSSINPRLDRPRMLSYLMRYHLDLDPSWVDSNPADVDAILFDLMRALGFRMIELRALVSSVRLDSHLFLSAFMMDDNADFDVRSLLGDDFIYGNLHALGGSLLKVARLIPRQWDSDDDNMISSVSDDVDGQFPSPCLPDSTHIPCDIFEQTQKDDEVGTVKVIPWIIEHADRATSWETESSKVEQLEKIPVVALQIPVQKDTVNAQWRVVAISTRDFQSRIVIKIMKRSKSYMNYLRHGIRLLFALRDKFNKQNNTFYDYYEWILLILLLIDDII